MRWRPIASGALSLIVLEVLVTSKQTGNLGSLLQLPATFAQHLIDPGLPAIPDRSGASGSSPAPLAPGSHIPVPLPNGGTWNMPVPSVAYNLPPSATNKPATPPTLTA
jgi:hypothetical protein